MPPAYILTIEQYQIVTLFSFLLPSPILVV